MDIHKPKPWHSVREFLKEYLIIVIGVLTALAAEQAAESWRWIERADEARGRIRTEVGHQYLVAQEYLAARPCLDRQLDELQQRLIASGPTLSPLPMAAGEGGAELVFSAPFRSWTDSAWQNALSEGQVAHLSENERRLLPIHYAQLASIRRFSEEQQQAMGRLQALGLPLPMPPEVKAEYLGLVAQERLRTQIMASLAQQMNGDVEALGYAPDAEAQRSWAKASATLSYCATLEPRPLGTAPAPGPMH